MRLFVIFCLAFSSSALAGYKMYADPCSREVYGCSGNLFAREDGEFMTSYSETCNGSSLYGESAVVWAFRLPEIGQSKVVTSAKFNFYYLHPYVKGTTIRLGPPVSLCGIPYRSGNISSPVKAGDHFLGAFNTDTTDCVALQANCYPRDQYPAWHVSDSNGSANLTAYIQAQLNAGARQGDWILLRMNPESRTTNTTRNSFANAFYQGGVFNAYIEYELADASMQVAPEITPGRAPVVAPIQHQPYYLQERELFGYNPHFFVNSPCFGPDNRPYIRAKYAVQTLSDNGVWIDLDFSSAVRACFPTWDGTWETFGPNSEDRIVFDDSNDAYLVVHPHIYNSTTVNQPFILLYSKNLCRTWTPYVLPSATVAVRMQFRDSHNDMTRPPTLLVRTTRSGGGASYLDLITPLKNANGILTIPPAIRANGNPSKTIVGGGLNEGKGAANLMVTKGDKVHIVFAGRYQEPGDTNGTPQYCITYDYSTNTMGSTVYLGSAGCGEPDAHNWPGITIDSQGYLHVIMASHGLEADTPDIYECFRYTRSVMPSSSTGGWTTPQNLPKGQTYCSLVTDPFDTVHLVARTHWNPEMKIQHERKPKNLAWTTRVPLVIPGGTVYMHPSANLNIDRRGRLFLYYSIYRNLEVYEQIIEHNFKYPCSVDNPIQQNPCILISDNAGLSWRICLTPDFQNGIIK